jgi:hypothetical protein
MSAVISYDNLTKTDITKFLKTYLNRFEELINIARNGDGTYVAVFNANDPAQMLKKINSGISVALNDWIEEEFKKSCKSFNRNIIFFESEEKSNALVLYWT